MEWIDRYLKNELWGEELALFEERLRTDIEFSKEVQLQRRLISLLKEEGLRETFHRAEQELSQQQEKPVVPLQRKKIAYFSIAATIAFLLMAAMIGYFLSNGNDIAFPEPALTAIAYQGDAEPPFPVMASRGSSPPQYIPVLIYPPTDKYTYHYQFADTLRLYGTFDVQKLMLSYQSAGNVYKLHVDSAEYNLQRGNSITLLE